MKNLVNNEFTMPQKVNTKKDNGSVHRIPNNVNNNNLDLSEERFENLINEGFLENEFRPSFNNGPAEATFCQLADLGGEQASSSPSSQYSVTIRKVGGV